MEVQVSNSSLTRYPNSGTTTELHKAWHLLALLLSVGHPASPEELAFRCNLFRAPTDYVVHLCSIPNSPICLTRDLFVSPSVVAFVAFREFVLNLNPIDLFLPRFEVGNTRQSRIWEDVVRTYHRRRKRLRSEVEVLPVSKTRAVLHSIDENEKDRAASISLRQSPNDCTQVHSPMGNYITRGIDTHACQLSTLKLGSDNLSGVVGSQGTYVNFNAGLLSNIEFQCINETSIFENMKWHQCVYTLKSQQRLLNFEKFPCIPHPIAAQKMKACIPHSEQSILNAPTESSAQVIETVMVDIRSRSRTSLCSASCEKEREKSKISQREAENFSHACVAKNLIEVEEERVFNCTDEKLAFSSLCHGSVKEDGAEAVTTFQSLMPNDAKSMNRMTASLDNKNTLANVESKPTFSSAELSACQKQPMKSPTKSKASSKTALRLASLKTAPDPKQKGLSKALGDKNAVGSLIQQLQRTRDEKLISMKKMLEQTCDQKMNSKRKWENPKERKEKPVKVSISDQQERKMLPKFEDFTIEDEEGSGGYGTVYKARRKNDGVTFAIKCPHTSANRHHVHNELKMLERFGGKNNVIKYEGSFKSGNSECIVLEHIKHDRPEILKKEIDVFQLQWYGYCMLRALAGMHKQGVVHRDVKPGNFLFSRNVNKGYLIDFNLAMDLHQKYGATDKLKAGSNASFSFAPLIYSRGIPPTNQKFLAGKSLEVTDHDAGKISKPHLLNKNLKRKAVEQTSTFSDLGSRNVMKSQGADGSGITSAKEATSTRTPSTERLREPIPCKGRQELITLVHKALQGPSHQAQSVPASKRKRISAFPGKVDRKHVYLTPMPLHSAGIAVAGAASCMVKNKGEGKQKREGPCVGTKGFRAPEVLFRSQYQGPKVDIWSAGVTLLYLMIGRTPFNGEPEQNIKEIAKLKGSEDLWEVAKLHNCESQFPPDLYDMQFLPSMKLRDWCKQNTKRPEFLDIIPRSLFDLVDKCLTVNPRSRISAEEALRHEFFAPCLEGLRKERLLRKGLSLDSGTAQPLHDSQQLVKASAE